jgi:hypothetical protein
LAGEEEGNYKYIDGNKDGKINSSDFVPYGSNLPDLTWGLTNKFSFKNFELSVLLQGQVGGDIYFLGAVILTADSRDEHHTPVGSELTNRII